MENSPGALGRTRGRTAAAAAASSSAPASAASPSQPPQASSTAVTPSPAAAAAIPTGATSDKYRRPQSPAQEDVDPAAGVNERTSHAGVSTLFIGGPPPAASTSTEAAAGAAEGDDDDETKRAGRKDDRPNPSPVPNRALQHSPFNSTKSTKMGVEKRVAIKKSKLIKCNLSEAQSDAIPGLRDPKFPKSAWFYGSIIGGGSKQGYTISIDLFPASDKTIKNVKTKAGQVRALSDNEEEPAFSLEEYLEGQSLNEIDLDDADPANRKKSPQLESAEAFDKLDSDARAVAKEYSMNWSKDTDVPPIIWKILADGESVKGADITTDASPINQDVNITIREGKAGMTDEEARGDGTYYRNFFDHFFPSLKGHAARIDKFHSSPDSHMYSTVKAKKIKFHDPDAENPDWKVEMCYAIMIAGATEVQNGVDNLWKKGKSLGLRDFPDFGQYIEKDVFKAFERAAPFVWADEKHWYVHKSFPTWDVLKPLLNGFNDTRRKFLAVALLLLDESMSGLRPKTSKEGGLPHISFEPRKPVELGAMLKNGVEAITGIMSFLDYMGSAEEQAAKKYCGMESHMPDRSTMPKATCEVLRQVEGSNLKAGGWVGGDAWFGSVVTAVEVYKRFGVHSTWVIKNNSSFFPKQALYSVMLARHGNRPAGHWVTFTTEISGVPLYATAYAWSQKGMSYFISTCGSTEKSCTPYQSWYENDFGGAEFKNLDRPKIAEFILNYLPLIDEHNRQRQSLLALEKCWPTKCCWFRLLTTIVGMSVVDEYYYYKYKDNNTYDIGIGEFANRIAKGLKKRERRCDHEGGLCDEYLVPITDDDGLHYREATDAEARTGKQKVPLDDSCWICKKYATSSNGPNRYHRTVFCCKECRTPICRVDRRNGDDRVMTCIDEHINGSDPSALCHPGIKKCGHYPSTKKRKL